MKKERKKERKKKPELPGRDQGEEEDAHMWLRRRADILTRVSHRPRGWASAALAHFLVLCI
jgi:hypothetical protein